MRYHSYVPVNCCDDYYLSRELYTSTEEISNSYPVLYALNLRYRADLFPYTHQESYPNTGIQASLGSELINQLILPCVSISRGVWSLTGNRLIKSVITSDEDCMYDRIHASMRPLQPQARDGIYTRPYSSTCNRIRQGAVILLVRATLHRTVLYTCYSKVHYMSRESRRLSAEGLSFLSHCRIPQGCVSQARTSTFAIPNCTFGMYVLHLVSF